MPTNYAQIIMFALRIVPVEQIRQFFKYIISSLIYEPHIL